MAPPRHSDVLARQNRQIRSAIKFRKEEGYDDLWKRMRDLYRGKHFEHLSKEDRMVVNIAFSTINVIAPSVAVNYPKITVNATKPEAAPHAIYTEAVVNYWWKHYKVRPQFRRAVKDFLVVGHGWMKTGYRYVEEDQVGDEEGDVSTSISDVSAEDRENVKDASSTPTTVITSDRPFAERVSPHDIFVDPDGTSMDDIRWIAQRVRRTMEDVKSDQRYSKTAREQLSAAAWSKWEDAEAGKEKAKDDGQGYIDVWEFYDIARNTMSVFCLGSDQFLVKPFKMPYAFGHPFIMIRNYDVPDMFYPMGDLEAIEPLQRELNETRTQMSNHRKRYARKYLFKESAFDKTGRAALESDLDNAMVPVKEGEENINAVVAPFPTVMTPPEFYNQSELIQSDASTVSGVSEYQRGSLPEIRRTATEAAIVQDASNARAADKLATIEQSIGAVASALIQLAQQYLEGEQVARIIGKDGKALWIKFDKDYIAGEFDFEVEAGSTAPNNESFRRQSALQVMDAMSPFLQMGVIDPGKLAMYVLQMGFGVKNPEQFVAAPPPMDPAAQQGAQMEDPMMQQGAMPPGMAPAPGMDPAAMLEGAVAPPSGTPADLSGIDPATLAALSSRLGLDTNTLGV